MMVLRRSMDYPQLLSAVRGRKVLIWTCNTCARLCGGLGGEESAKRLADRLSEDGVNVVGVISTSASCLEEKVIAKCDSFEGRADLIISLTCDVGSRLAAGVFGIPAIDPLETLGPGHLDRNGMPVLRDGSVVMMGTDPLV